MNIPYVNNIKIKGMKNVIDATKTWYDNDKYSSKSL